MRFRHGKSDSGPGDEPNAVALQRDRTTLPLGPVRAAAWWPFRTAEPADGSEALSQSAESADRGEQIAASVTVTFAIS